MLDLISNACTDSSGAVFSFSAVELALTSAELFSCLVQKVLDMISNVCTDMLAVVPYFLVQWSLH